MKKMIITFLILAVMVYGFICIADNRIRKIDNGEMTLVNQDQMDR
jgi:hypothetical protein